jgi:hypothetical protein
VVVCAPEDRCLLKEVAMLAITPRATHVVVPTTPKGCFIAAGVLVLLGFVLMAAAARTG